MQTRLTLAQLTRLPKTCTECRRRKQKCLPSPSPSTQCLNCAKRWPPVHCVFREPKQPSRPQHPSFESIFVFSANDTDPDDASESPSSSRSSSGGSSSSSSSSSSTSSSPVGDPETDARANALSRAMVGSPRAVGGTLSVIGSCQGSIPVPNTARNNELFYFFIEYVAPSIVSIDGVGLPPAFRAVMLPWILQSPLFPHIAVLMSSVTQALDLGRQPNETVEPLVLKSRVLTIINKALSTGHDLSDLLRCAINLVVIEWYWGDDDSMWTHMRGIRDLVRSRGGFEALNDPMFVVVVILMDYCLGACFETDLLMQERTPDRHLTPPLPSQCSPSLIGPLHPRDCAFSSLADTLSLPPEAASIVSSAHHLTLLIVNSAPENYDYTTSPPPTPTATIRATAATIHKCLLLSPPSPASSSTDENHVLTTALHLTALFYTISIATSTPLSTLKTSPSLTLLIAGLPAIDAADALYASIRAVPSSRWKRMPGVFLWVMLVAAAQRTRSTAGEGGWESPRQRERKYLRRRMATAAQAVAQEDFGVGIWCLRGFWLVGSFEVVVLG
ncbi:hypothetical protein B0T18DRAFT_492785 [Schizothecium vesticola]|uniref:Zn(2)-C6 fungal-type domain-containing protein n=1 Tax=Schizothecium vesticola TaxID=314040 RepID=A0AA40BR93_9PEZI|nr:hypothetical protein B0T18DRAFT_492785 [Schizothecium vesticola]